MFTDQTLIIINAVCIISLLLLLAILTGATRMKGGAGLAALIIVTTTVPIYLLNLMRDMSSPENYRLAAYIACFLNVLCIPALWFFVRRQYDKSFHFTLHTVLHLVPAVVSLATFIICYSPMTDAQLAETMRFMESGGEDLPTLINDIIIATQLLVYFPLMLLYIRRRKKYLKDNYADSDSLTLRWTQSFIAVFFGLFIAVFVAYTINPRTDIWLIPILNVLAMSYLVFVVVRHSTAPYLNRLPDASSGAENETHSPAMDAAQMKDICDKVMEYLVSTKAYTDPGLSLPMLSLGTGIHHKNISAAINGYLHRNFFELVNGLRVEEAKKELSTLDGNRTVESIAADCGFRSRSTFFAAFRKATGKTPAEWMKMSNA